MISSQLRICQDPTADSESIIAQRHGRALQCEPLRRLKDRSLGLMQIQHRVSLVLPEPDQFCPGSKTGNKIKWSGSVNFYRALTFDMSRVSDIKDGQPRTLVLLNIKKGCAIYRLVQEHRVAALPRRCWKFRRRNDNQIA